MKGTIITKTKTNTIEPAYDNNENATTNTTIITIYSLKEK
jgi:hypothetical protein